MRKLLTLLIASMALCFQAISPAYALLAMRVSSLSDMNLPSWNIGDGSISAHMDLCVHTAGIIPAGGYKVTVSSNTGSYVLKNGVRQIPYSLYWDDGGAGNLGAGLGTQLSHGVTLANQLHGNIIDNGCTLTGPNARLNLKITASDMTAALAGTYSAVITVLVVPY